MYCIVLEDRFGVASGKCTVGEPDSCLSKLRNDEERLRYKGGSSKEEKQFCREP